MYLLKINSPVKNDPNCYNQLHDVPVNVMMMTNSKIRHIGK